MATSGRIETGRVSNYTCFYHQWQLAGQDVAGNFSRINWQAGINIQNWARWGTNAVRITGGGLDGRGIGTGTWSNLSGNGDKQLLAGTFDIGHNGDGTKAFWYDIAGNLLGVGGNAGAWTDVPTIPRQSNPTFSKGLYTIGEEIVVNMNRKAGFTHRGSLQVPDMNVIHEFSGITDQLRWKPTETHIEEIYRRMANTTKTTLGVDTTTWNGGTQIGGVGWQNVEIQLDNANILPVFSNFTFKDTNTATVAITGNDQVLIAGKSTLRAEISASDKMTAQKFATPREYTAQFDGQTQTKAYSETENIIFDFENPPKTAGNILTQITAKDSRNLGQTVSRNVQIIPYSTPALRLEAKRQNNFDDTTELKISGNFAPLTISGINKNRIVSLRYRTRPTSGSFGDWKTISPTQGTGSFQASTEYLNFESAQAYEIEVEVTDRLESSQAKIVVDRGKPIFFIASNKEKVGINKVPEFGDLDVAGDVYSRGKKVLTGGGLQLVGVAHMRKEVNFHGENSSGFQRYIDWQYVDQVGDILTPTRYPHSEAIGNNTAFIFNDDFDYIETELTLRPWGSVDAYTIIRPTLNTLENSGSQRAYIDLPKTGGGKTITTSGAFFDIKKGNTISARVLFLTSGVIGEPNQGMALRVKCYKYER